MTRTAVCCCGAASITVTGEPSVNGVCHCADCKRRTGSAFGWQVYFRDDEIVEKLGQVSVYVIGEPPRQERWFCQACGSTLYWKTSFMPHHTGVAAGNFGDPPMPEPTLTVSNDKRCAWVGLPETWSRGFKPPA